MKKKLSTLLILFTLLFSCKNNQLEEYIKISSNADNVDISSKNDTCFIHLTYKIAPHLTSDLLSSITAISYYDTARIQLEKDKISIIKVSINTSTATEVYQYPISIIQKAKTGLEKTALFINNMRNGQSEQNEPLVDLEQISLEDLTNLNLVNDQINSTMPVEYITHDGFKSEFDDKSEIEIRAQLVSKSKEVIPLVFQYNIDTEKIYYFGINE